MEDIHMRKYNHKISERANESLNKRDAIVRKQKGLLALVILIVVSLGILLGTSINALASSQKDISSYNKYYKSICIESGDTLWAIADTYVEDFNISKADYIAEICEINQISQNEIHAGDYIVVPYYSQDFK
jgi:cell division protein YceG involved in septum cleavage